MSCLLRRQRKEAFGFSLPSPERRKNRVPCEEIFHWQLPRRGQWRGRGWGEAAPQLPLLGGGRSGGERGPQTLKPSVLCIKVVSPLPGWSGIGSQPCLCTSLKKGCEMPPKPSIFVSSLLIRAMTRFGRGGQEWRSWNQTAFQRPSIRDLAWKTPHSWPERKGLRVC